MLSIPFLKNTTPYAIAGLLVLAASCSSKDSATPSANGSGITYAISNVGGAFPTQTTYVQGLKNLDMTTLNNSNAAEATGFSSQWSYNGAVYLTAFGAPATMTKYTFDTSGKAIASGQLIVQGANTFSSVEFVSATEAYASVGGGLAKVIKFNPTTFQKTGEIDLSGITRPNAASIYYLGMKARDNKLFLGVQYFNANFDPLADSAFVAVIDLPTTKVDKLIADARTSNIFLAGSSVSGFAQDSNGDLYIQGNGSGSAPSGILRIKKGETTFDPTYFFNLKSATGKDCSALYLFNNGIAFTTRMEDASDPYESNGPNFRYYKIDLSGKKSLGELSASLPNIYGSSTSIMRQFDAQNITFVVSSSKENSIYSYNTGTGAIAKKITLTSGTCTGLDKIK